MKFKLYQINLKKTHAGSRFCDYDIAVKHGGVNPCDYDCVYEGSLNVESLEDVYTEFNIRPSMYYQGRSMSVSDVVVVLESETIGTGAYYCDSVGFEKIKFNKGE